MRLGRSNIFIYLLHIPPPHSLRRNGKKWPLCKKRLRKPVKLLYSTSYLGPKNTLRALAQLWDLHLEHCYRPIWEKVSSLMGILLPKRKMVIKWIRKPKPLSSLLGFAVLRLVQKEIYKHVLEKVFILHGWEYITGMLWSLPSGRVFHHLKWLSDRKCFVCSLSFWYVILGSELNIGLVLVSNLWI